MSLKNALLHNEIIQSYEKGDWENVLKIQAALEEAYFLWPKPEKRDLDFIALSLKILNVSTLVSIGCGTGLLEWLLGVSTGLNVIGVEVDKNYWASKYARPHFINMIFPEDRCFFDTIHSADNALLFCYFNYKNAFLDYLDIYEGSCIIIIGPHNSGRHTEPAPFDSDIPPEWKVWGSKEIENTGDYIVIYERTLS